jgi:uncharacterized lipoprotein YmbA
MKSKYYLLLTALLLLSGCSSKSNFYQLHTAQINSANKATNLKRTVIGVAEVDIPEYLDKPEVVTRLSQGRLQVNETERWAGAFDKNIQSVLTQNLSGLLPQYTFMTYPWDEPLKEKYRIYLSIVRFDGDTTTGMVRLEGRWTLVNIDDNSVVIGQDIQYNEHVVTQKSVASIDEMVAMQSQMINKLSRIIARKVRRHL